MLEGTIRSTGGWTSHAEADRDRQEREPRRRNLLARLSVMSLAGFGQRLDVDRGTETEATAVARSWLEVIDAGHPAVGWTAAAPMLRDTTDPDDWALAVRSVRAPLGRQRSRRLLGRATVEGFPGVPHGPYAVIHFQTEFSERPAVIETVTTCLADDGRWRVAAYFIR